MSPLDAMGYFVAVAGKLADLLLVALFVAAAMAWQAAKLILRVLMWLVGLWMRRRAEAKWRRRWQRKHF